MAEFIVARWEVPLNSENEWGLLDGLISENVSQLKFLVLQYSDTYSEKSAPRHLVEKGDSF